MQPKFKIHIVNSTLADYEHARAWWAAHRPKAPLAIEEDFDEAMQRLEEHGDKIGAPIGPLRRGYRRLLLPRVRYYVYFRHLDKAGVIEVLALWHVSRGEPPQI
ncbi:MAG: type II toxin-antitoxin system RelE/ParE family toxin [Myxococcota bacterium]